MRRSLLNTDLSKDVVIDKEDEEAMSHQKIKLSAVSEDEPACS